MNSPRTLLNVLFCLLATNLMSGATAVAPNALSAEEKRQGFSLLFDGKTFNGWKHGGNWVIEDGALWCKGKGGDVTYDRSRVPDDFEVRFEWKVSKGCNSGVYYRPTQYEYQVLDNVNSPYGENPRQAAASLFFCMAPSRDASRAYGEWNEGRITCKGTVIQHWLNGEKVIDFDYTDPRWAREVEILRIRGGDLTARGAFLRLQFHGQEVWFRSLRWRTIPADEPLRRDPFTPMPVPAAALVKENARLDGMLKAKAAGSAEKARVLFNGKTLEGGKAVAKRNDPTPIWSVRDGSIACLGKPSGYLRTMASYSP